MTENARRAAELRTLLGRLAHQRRVLERISQRLERARTRAADGTDPEAVAAAALYLQHFYTGIEDALLRVAEALDGSVPTGEDWHRLLVEQMTFDIPHVRPAIVEPELGGHLDVLRRFRHRVRHAYDEEYQWPKMAEPLQAWSRSMELLPAFLAGVDGLVARIVRALEAPPE